MNKIHMLLASALVLSMIGCGSSPTAVSQSTNQSTSQGKWSPISLTYNGKTSLAKVVATDSASLSPSQEVPLVDADLGISKETDRHLFNLVNTAGGVITGMTITSTNPAVIVTPSIINSLAVPGKEVGITPILDVTIVNGKSPTGDIPTPVLKDSIIDLTFSGTTKTPAGTDTTFTLTYKMVIHPRYVSWSKFKEFQGNVRGIISNSAEGCAITEATYTSLPSGNVWGTKPLVVGDTTNYGYMKSDCVFDNSQKWPKVDHFDRDSSIAVLFIPLTSYEL